MLWSAPRVVLALERRSDGCEVEDQTTAKGLDEGVAFVEHSPKRFVIPSEYAIDFEVGVERTKCPFPADEAQKLFCRGLPVLPVCTIRGREYFSEFRDLDLPDFGNEQEGREWDAVCLLRVFDGFVPLRVARETCDRCDCGGSGLSGSLPLYLYLIIHDVPPFEVS